LSAPSIAPVTSTNAPRIPLGDCGKPAVRFLHLREQCQRCGLGLIEMNTMRVSGSFACKLATSDLGGGHDLGRRLAVREIVVAGIDDDDACRTARR
jgi:hypothetical protein